jgi:hypothetical protein
MTAEFSINTKLTSITAAYLTATGWYQMNNDFVRYSNWGLRRGCSFLSTVAPFCPTGISEYGVSETPQCSIDYTFKGVFETSVTKDVMEACNVLKPNNVFGIVTESNFCTSNLRTLNSSAATDGYLETFGANSRCFMANYKHKSLKVKETSVSIPVCHNSMCEFSPEGDWILKITIDNYLIICPFEGGEVTLTGSKCIKKN